jgi:hypothetical protein
MSVQMVPCRFCGTTTEKVEGAVFTKCSNCESLAGPQQTLSQWVMEGRDPRDWYIGHGIGQPVATSGDYGGHFLPGQPGQPTGYGYQPGYGAPEYPAYPGTGLPLDPNFSVHTTGPSPIVEHHVTIDIGPHLSHLLKRLFPKQQQQEVDALTGKLKTSSGELETAIAANTPQSEGQLTNKGESIMAGTDLTGITAQVTANTDAEASAVVLLNSLSALIAANKTDPVALQALSDQLKTSAGNLAAAIVANTPAA